MKISDQYRGNLQKSQTSQDFLDSRFEHVLEKVLIDGQLNSLVFVCRVTLCYTFLINVMTSLVFSFSSRNIFLSSNWVNPFFQYFIQNNGSWWFSRYVHRSCRYVAYCRCSETPILSFCSDCRKSRKILKSGKWNMHSKNIDCHIRRFWRTITIWILNIFPINIQTWYIHANWKQLCYGIFMKWYRTQHLDTWMPPWDILMQFKLKTAKRRGGLLVTN
jgi:hypothetical protein